jgi:hypothetical protein
MINRMKTVLVAGAAALLVAPASWAALATFSQDFETLGAGDPGALSGSGFLISGIVFDGDSGANPPYGFFKFFYGNFPAPNGGPGFSAIASGEAGPPQGTQYVNVYSDYNCCGAGNTNEGHFDTTGTIDVVESNVFLEQIIGPADIGQTWALKFDAKLPSSNGCGTGIGNAPPDAFTECLAFIRTLDPNNGFATTYQTTFNSRTLSSGSWSSQELAFALSNPLLDGQILQFGFNSRSKQFANTGVYYDNINFTVVPVPGALWLFGSALGAVGLLRRKSIA